MIDYILQTIREAAIKYDVSAWALEKTLRCESIDFKWQVITGHQLGPAGEQGIAQLYVHGLLPTFYALGYESPYSIAHAVDFIARMFAAGNATHWSCFCVAVLGVAAPC